MLESVVPSGLLGNQRPGLLHLPEGSDAYVEDALYLLGEWGFSYDDAQSFVIGSSLREMPDGRWAAKEVGVEEPRQNGKGETIEGREALGLFYLDERKLIHSAHEFATASEALDRMDDRIGQNPQLKRRVRTVKRSHGEEGVYLKDGRSLRYKTRTKGGGRGFSADLLILDEAMYIAEAFLGALMPVISARPNPQMWYTGSAVDQNTMDNGLVFSRLRQRALEHQPGRMAYFGWSAAYENGKVVWDTPADIPREATRDPVVIARGNPALGIRIDLEHIIDTEWQAMSHETFCVERLGIGDWPSPGADLGDGISKEMWDGCEDEESVVVDPVRFAVDVTPDRQRAAIGVAGYREDGLRHVEIVAHKSGTRWVVEELQRLLERHDTGPVVLAGRSPAAALISKLVEAGVQFEVVDTGEFAQACGVFYDDVDDAGIRHLGTPELKAAALGAKKRPVGESWVWSRKSSAVDISPLIACTLARFALGGQRPSVYEQRGVLVV